MIRYRYGPWDPSYYAILGKLIGKGLIKTVPNQRGLSYRTTEWGKQISNAIAKEDSWAETNVRVKLLKKNFDLKGNALKDFIYQNFPEVTSASWGQKI